jgi:hypothetical protein
MKGRHGGVENKKVIELSKIKVQSLFIIIAHLSSRKKDEPERNVGVLSSKARTQVFSITQ